MATASCMSDYMEAIARRQPLEVPQGYGYKADIGLGWGFFLEESTGCKILERPIHLPSGSPNHQGYLVLYAYCQEAGVKSILEGQVPDFLPATRKDPKEFASMEAIANNFGMKDPKKAAPNSEYCVPFRVPSDLVQQAETPGRDIWVIKFNEDKVGPFLQWAKSGTVEKIKKALGDISSDTCDEQGVTALMMAAMGGWEETCQALISKGATVNMQEPTGQKSPLMFASQGGHKKSVEVLLQAGADPNAVDSEGMTSLMWAATAGHAEVVKMLAAYPNRDAVNAQGHTAKQCAEAMKHTAVVAALS